MIASAGEAVTAMELEVPVMVGVTVSVAVIVWLPGVSSVIWTVTDPVCSVALAGRMAAPSELVMWTVPL